MNSQERKRTERNEVEHIKSFIFCAKMGFGAKKFIVTTIIFKFFIKKTFFKLGNDIWKKFAKYQTLKTSLGRT